MTADEFMQKLLARFPNCSTENSKKIADMLSTLHSEAIVHVDTEIVADTHCPTPQRISNLVNQMVTQRRVAGVNPDFPFYRYCRQAFGPNARLDWETIKLAMRQLAKEQTGEERINYERLLKDALKEIAVAKLRKSQ